MCGAFPEGAFTEVFVKCDLDVCKRRDPRGLYKKAEAGEIKDFTGIDSAYEEPTEAEVVVETDIDDADTIVAKLHAYLKEQGII